MGSSRSGRPRRRACALVRASQSHCWLCGRWIDQQLDRQRHDLASSIDEVIPVVDGGSTTDPANLRHAHRFCNSFRQQRPVTLELRLALVDALIAKGYLRPAERCRPSRVW